MGVAYNVSIPTNSLEICLDKNNIKSYPGTGSAWNELISNNTFNGNAYASSLWANNINALTICTVIEKIGDIPGYALHPINKWNSGTGNASFVLYHFGASGGQGNFSFYYTQESSWTGRFVTTLSVGQTAHMVFQWNSTNGGQVWLNGNKVGGRSGSGRLGVNGTSGIGIAAPTDPYSTVHHTSIYSRDLSDNEVLNHYRSIGKRYGL
jgi:hypothetical protein